MLRFFIVFCFFLIHSNVFCQWKNENVNNGFDEPFKMSTTSLNGKCYLRLFEPKVVNEIEYSDSVTIKTHVGDTIIKFYYSPEYPDGKADTIINSYTYPEKNIRWAELYSISLDLVGSYFCSDDISVDIVLIVNGESKKYSFKSDTYLNHKGLQLLKIMYTSINQVEFIEESKDFVLDFKKASQMNIRVNDNYCDSQYFEFNMKGSTSAINYMISK